VETTNPIYRCEEFEDAMSVYDDIKEDHYDDLNEQQVYLDILSDEIEGCDKGKTPELPSPRPVTTSQDQKQDRDYEGLKEEKPDHVYLQVLNNETDECDKGIKDEDQDQDQSSKPQEEDKRSTLQDQDQDHDNNTQC